MKDLIEFAADVAHSTAATALTNGELPASAAGILSISELFDIVARYVPYDRVESVTGEVALALAAYNVKMTD